MNDSNTVNSTIDSKSFQFAVRIIRLYEYLIDKPKSGKVNYTLAKQLLRSGTSIGANVSEAECAISKSDFAAKMYIAYKECSETKYWLRLLYETNYLTEVEYNSIFKDCNELIRLLAAITKTVRARYKSKE